MKKYLVVVVFFTRNPSVRNFGFIRVGVAVPRVRVGEPEANALIISSLLEEAETLGISLLVFPELSLTGYTCGDLFHSQTLLEGTLTALEILCETTRFRYRGVAVVGLPFLAGGSLYDCAAILKQGEVLGLVPKIFLPNYKEFYERRWFTPGGLSPPQQVNILGRETWLGNHLLFAAHDFPEFIIGVEICEDLWVPAPPSTFLAQWGATVIANLSASDEFVGKATYRRTLVVHQSARTITAYLYSSAGVGESTTDLVYSGHALIAENGLLLKEAPRWNRDSLIIYSDLDLERIVADRRTLTSFADSRSLSGNSSLKVIPFTLGELPEPKLLKRPLSPYPFIPEETHELHQRCEEIFAIQTTALMRRLEYVQPSSVTLGVSGGLDSTLALLVTTKALSELGMGRERFYAYLLPGFGTSRRTLENARALTRALEVKVREIDIRPLVLEILKALGHRPFGLEIRGITLEQFLNELKRIPAEKRHDLLFENVQARLRTQILMNAGFMIGTGDLSELALGFCTYGGDHMCMYNPNASVPKTLVRFLIEWARTHIYAGTSVEAILTSILETTISPELLPLDEGGVQATEAIIGPYELHDFFLYYFLRYGYSPRKILFLANQVKFSRPYTRDEIRHWLKVFLQRFFSQQYKRSTFPDGPKVGSVSLSPRGDFRMPSDVEAKAWLKDLEEEENS